MYLRKSRKDVQAERHGEGDTLKRHKRALYDLAERLKIEVEDSAVYEEVVSGETIAARPKMQQLLSEIDAKMWTGVLVIEVERLTRGDHADQGTIIDAFKYSKTKIITPMKTYDPTDPTDIQYFEFGLFLSRQEYRTINRRLQEGRNRSVLEGKYVSNKPLYGYRRVPLPHEQGWTLEEIPEQADVVRDIFEWYTKGIKLEDGTYKRLGVSLIARRLNMLMIPATGKRWYQETIRDMLINPHYIGKVRWNWRHVVTEREKGEKKKSRPRADATECTIADGLHKAIVDVDVYNRAQEIMNSNPPRPKGERGVVKSPLSGLVECGKCGRKMARRPYGKSGYPDTILCQSMNCPNVSAHLHLVENAILNGLQEWLAGYKLQWGIDDSKRGKKKRESTIDLKRKQVEKKSAEIETLKKQLSAARDALERGVYEDAEYIERRRELNEQIKQAEAELVSIENVVHIEEAREENRINVIPKVEHVLEVYHELESPADKNALLKSVLEKVKYTKEKGGRWNAAALDEFEIELFPILPEFTRLSGN